MLFFMVLSDYFIDLNCLPAPTLSRRCYRSVCSLALRLRNLEEMMAERGVIVDHSTLHRWLIRLVPLLDKVFRRHKRTVGRRWRMDETYIKIKM